MRALLLALALGAATAGAQVTAPTMPVAPKPKSSGGELRIGGIMISGERSYEFLNSVQNEVGSIKGVDVLLRSRVIGLSFRSLSGTFGDQPHVTSADARLLLGPPVFTIMGGAGRRALWSDLNAESPSQFDIGIAGLSSTVTIGGTGLRTNINGAVYLPVGESKDRIKSGMEGEASVLWRFPKLPFFVQVGYRTEVFTAKNKLFETPEEVRGVRLGGGLQLGGR